MLGTGSGLAASLSPSPTGAGVPLDGQSLARTVFWFKDKENGKPRTVGRAKLTIMCAPGDSECDVFQVPHGISHLFIYKIYAYCSIENKVSMTNLSTFFCIIVYD